jgi:hypothetical protein
VRAIRAAATSGRGELELPETQVGENDV